MEFPLSCTGDSVCQQLFTLQALCHAIASSGTMTAEQVVKNEFGEEVSHVLLMPLSPVSPVPHLVTTSFHLLPSCFPPSFYPSSAPSVSSRCYYPLVTSPKQGIMWMETQLQQSRYASQHLCMAHNDRDRTAFAGVCCNSLFTLQHGLNSVTK